MAQVYVPRTSIAMSEHHGLQMAQVIHSLHHAMSPIDFLDKAEDEERSRIEEDEDEMMCEKYNSNVLIIEEPLEQVI